MTFAPFRPRTYVYVDVNSKTFSGVLIRKGLRYGELVGTTDPQAPTMPLTVAWHDGTVSTEDDYEVVVGD